jgi:hypothetical protein
MLAEYFGAKLILGSMTINIFNVLWNLKADLGYQIYVTKSVYLF